MLESLVMNPKAFLKLGGSKANIRSNNIISMVGNLPFINNVTVQALTIKRAFVLLGAVAPSLFNIVLFLQDITVMPTYNRGHIAHTTVTNLNSPRVEDLVQSV